MGEGAESTFGSNRRAISQPTVPNDHFSRAKREGDHLAIESMIQ
jgi:hypothetical protein